MISNRINGLSVIKDIASLEYVTSNLKLRSPNVLRSIDLLKKKLETRHVIVEKYFTKITTKKNG